MAITVSKLLKMTQAQLDELFSSVAAGPIPKGEAEGTAIVAPGTHFSPTIAKFVNLFAQYSNLHFRRTSIFIVKLALFYNILLFLCC